MLRDPDLRVVYVTSSPVAEPIVDYYLSLLGPELARDARERLTMISRRRRLACARCRPSCSSARALLARIRWAIPDHRALPPRPLRLDRARAGGRRRPRHPGPRRRPRARLPRDQERVARAVRARRRAAPARRRADHQPRRRGQGDRRACARPSRGCPGRRQARRRRLGRGQRDRRAARPARARARATRSAGSACASTRCSSRRPGVPLAVYLERLSHGGVVEERIVGARAAQPERPARAHARRRGADRLDA